MRIPERIIEFRVHPYMQEASVQIMVDTLLIALAFGVMYFAGFSLIVYLALFLIYGTVALTLHYRVAIQAIIDKRKGDYITETVNVVQFNLEFSFAGNSLGESYARLFYPREMDVHRHKIKIICNDGQKKKIRSFMSYRRVLKFIFLDPEQKEQLQVSYLRRSKILLRVELSKELDKKTSRKKRHEIEKAIRYINSSI